MSRQVRVEGGPVELPLAPLRVLDLTWGMPGAVASMFLCDFGAEVIKVERPGGDPLRRFDLHRAWDRGKRSLVADLGREADRVLVRRLAEEADVVMAADSLTMPGLDRDALLEANPAMVHCSLSGYGPASGWERRPGYPSLVAARLGLMADQGGYREGPIYLGHPGIEYATAYMTIITVLAGVYARSVTGRGQQSDVSLLDGTLALLTLAWGSERGRITVERRGTLDTGRRRLLLDTFECADGKLIMVHTGAAGAFARALVLLELDSEIPVEAGPVEMASELSVEEHAVLKGRLPGIFKSRTRDDWLKLLWDNEVAALPFLPPGAVFDDPQVRHNRLVQTVMDPELGALEVVGPPVRIGGEPVLLEQPAPRLDEHGAAIRAHGWTSASAPVSASPRSLRHPLEGVRVLDMGAYFAGPFASRLLSDLGADVVKVEQVSGDAMRPLLDLFEAASRGKRSLALNLKAEPAVEVARRLIASADVLHHNLRPGAAERIGIGYQQAATINPALVYLHAPGYGSSGPKAALQSFAPLHSGFVGMWHEAAGEGNPPIRSFGNEDHYNGLLGAASILLGLVARQRDGHGLHLEAAQLQSSLLATSHVVRRGGQVLNTLPRLDAGQYGRGPFDRIYACSSGWVAIVCCTRRHVAAALATLGLSERWKARYAPEDQRSPDSDGALAADMAARFAMRSAPEWATQLDGASVPCEVVREDPWEPVLFADDALEAAGMVSEDIVPHWGPVRSLALLFHLSGTPGVVRGRAPLIGEQSSEILAELGIDAADIDEWRSRGVIRQVSVHDVTAAQPPGADR